jgi:hypothetical protein
MLMPIFYVFMQELAAWIWHLRAINNSPFKPKLLILSKPPLTPLLSQNLEGKSRFDRGTSLFGGSLDSPLLGRSNPHHLSSDSQGKSSR